MKETVGFIGLGGMGLAMAANLLKAGFGLRVYNRTAEKARSLLELGATWRAARRRQWSPAASW
jgi:3-hydroxyisobutyrate dehydrogenase-like beta-hydroxyacid dehydrogenase